MKFGTDTVKSLSDLPVHYQIFDTLGKIVDYTKVAKTSETFRFCDSSQHKANGDLDFYGTESFEEAVRFAEFGWEEGYKKIMEYKEDYDVEFQRIPKPRGRRYNLCGHTPSVPRALMGVPDSMLDVEDILFPHDTIDLYVSFANLSNVSHEAIFKRGASICALVDHLESHGTRVGVKMFAGSRNLRGKSSAIMTIVDVKKPEESLNMLKLAFVVANAGMFRRFGFRVKETLTYCDTKGYVDGYGRTDDEVCLEWLKEHEKGNAYSYIPSVSDVGKLWRKAGLPTDEYQKEFLPKNLKKLVEAYTFKPQQIK